MRHFMIQNLMFDPLSCTKKVDFEGRYLTSVMCISWLAEHVLHPVWHQRSRKNAHTFLRVVYVYVQMHEVLMERQILLMMNVSNLTCTRRLFLNRSPMSRLINEAGCAAATLTLLTH